MDNGLVIDGVQDSEETTDIVQVPQSIVKTDNLDICQVKERADLIQDLLKSVMVEGEHYGKIPGVSKNILFKAGAEKIGMVFRINPTYTVKQIDYDNFHRENQVTCTLTHVNGVFVGQGVGSCSTLESKYRYRNAQRICPTCGVAAIIKGKEQYGGGWVCYKKKNGCGAKYTDDDKLITSQEVGRVENPDIPDLWNTVLKMAKKRAHVDAVITATGASDIFTQDLDPVDEKPKPKTKQQVYKGQPVPKDTASYADIMELINELPVKDRLMYKEMADEFKKAPIKLAEIKDKIKLLLVAF